MRRDEIYLPSSHANPLAGYLLEAQQIVVRGLRPHADQGSALKCLADLLCTPLATAALMAAGALPGIPSTPTAASRSGERGSHV